jgi:hypothetical protein
MSKHTHEPWKYQEGFANVYSFSNGDWGTTQHIAKMNNEQIPGGKDEAEANAHRIVACVNACQGLGTEWLEQNKIIDNLRTDEQLPPTDTEAMLTQVMERIDSLEAENAFLQHQIKLADDAMRQAVAAMGAVL